MEILSLNICISHKNIWEFIYKLCNALARRRDTPYFSTRCYLRIGDLWWCYIFREIKDKKNSINCLKKVPHYLFKSISFSLSYSLKLPSKVGLQNIRLELIFHYLRGTEMLVYHNSTQWTVVWLNDHWWTWKNNNFLLYEFIGLLCVTMCSPFSTFFNHRLYRNLRVGFFLWLHCWKVSIVGVSSYFGTAGVSRQVYFGLINWLFSPFFF